MSSVLELLIKAGADVNRRVGKQPSPLMAAAASGFEDCVNKLIKAGADVNMTQFQGASALICAAEKGFTSIGCFAY